MKRRLRWLAAFIVGVGVAAAGRPALAEPSVPSVAPSDDAIARALARFKSGQELYAERNFAAALVELRKAYELAPNYRVQYNIGQVCFQMQDYVCALQAFQRYLADGGDEVPAARRQVVQQEIDALQLRVGAIRLTVDVAGAEVSVDDVAIGTTPLPEAIVVSAGRRHVAIMKQGHVTVARFVDVAGHDTEELSVTLPPAVSMPAATAPAAPPPVRTAETPAPAKRLTTWSWVGYGVGAGLLAGGAVTGVLALGAGEDVKSKVYASEADAQAARDRAGTLGLATDGLVAAGVVTAVVTTVLTFVVSRDGSKNVGAVDVAPGRGGAGVRWRF